MGREGWIYLIVFLGILGAGVALIGPELGGPGRREAPADSRELPSDDVVSDAPPAPPPPPLRVRVTGEEGGEASGAPEVVEGAEVLAREVDGASARFELRPTAPAVAFRAPGCRPAVVPVAALRRGDAVRLAPAAAPLVLRVREADGTPAGGIPLRLLPFLPGPAPRTDPAGVVELRELAPGLVVVDVGADERQGPTLRLVAGEDREVEAILEPAFEIGGRVVDGAGRPLAGAHVDALGAEGVLGRALVTGADGRFRWRGPVAGVLALRVQAPPRAPLRVEVRATARSLRQDLGDLALDRAGASIDGRVVVEKGLGAPQARLEYAVGAILRELFGDDAALDVAREIELAPDGSFHVDGLAPDVPYRVAVRGAGVPVDHEVAVGPGEAARFDLAPPVGRILEGRVLDGVDGDRPVEGLQLLLSPAPHDEARPLASDVIAVTDAEGRFRVGGLASGELFLRAYPDGRRAVLRRLVLPRAVPLDVVLESEADAPRLEGRVVDDENLPLPGVRVRAAGREATTDAEGRFVLEGVETFGDEVEVEARFEPGRPVPEVDPRPFAAGVVRRVPVAGPPPKLVLPRTRSLRFRAVDGIDDAPLAFVQVLVRTDDGQIVVDRAVATRDGHVVLDGLPPTGIVVALFTPRHRLVRPVPVRADVTPSPVLDLGELRVAHGMRIVGRVADDAGVPIPGARIAGLEGGWLRTRGDDPTLRRELALRWVETDAEGRYEFEGFDPRRPAVLAAWAEGFAPAARRAVVERFREDVGITVDLVLRRGGWLSVQLLEKGSQEPISGALFDLEDARTSSDYLDVLRRGMLGGPAASSRDWRLASAHFLFERRPGLYRLGPVAPGPYEVWVERPGYRPLRHKLTILDPEDGLIDVARGTSRSVDLLTQDWEMEPGP